MKSYIGCKIVDAEPEVRNGRLGYMVMYPDGYASWSPMKAFDNAYREITEAEKKMLQTAMMGRGEHGER